MEGQQGAGKSTALRHLAGEDFFGDALPHMGSKDASDYIRGKWIVELSELSNINKAEVEVVKAFISRSVEKFRPAYGRVEIEYRRQCVFAGTTNKSEYLRDETGNRRFWPIECGKIDLQGIIKERGDLWGAAALAFDSGENWWLSADGEVYARAEQDQRLSEDVWVAEVRNFCADKKDVSIPQIAQILGVETNNINRAVQNRIGAAITAIGWVRDGKFFSGSNRGKVRYVPKVSSQ